MGATVNSPRIFAFAQSNTTQQSSGQLSVASLMFAGAGGASVGVSNGSVVVSAPTGGGADGGVFAGVSNVGNTAGSTGTVSTGNFVLVGTNGITLSQSTGAAGSAATITIDGGGYRHQMFDPFLGADLVGTTFAVATMNFCPVQIPDVQFDRVGIRVNWNNTSNSTGSATLSHWFGVYTRNASTLSLYASTSHTFALTFSGTVGNNSLQLGRRILTVPWTTTLTQCDYWVGFNFRSTTGGANGTFSHYCPERLNVAHSGIMGAASNASGQSNLGQGVYTASTTAVPGSVAFSQINGSAFSHQNTPAWFLLNQSA